MKILNYQKIDALLLASFQLLIKKARKLKISRTLLINIILSLQIAGYIVHLVSLSIINGVNDSVLLLSLPTWLSLSYFIYIIKKSKKRPVDITYGRKFSTMFLAIVLFNFIFKISLVLIFKKAPDIYFFVSQIAYVVSSIAMFCIMYLLSCSDYQSSINYHRHKCYKCGTVWEHSDACQGDRGAHTCSKCGREQWMKYY